MSLKTKFPSTWRKSKSFLNITCAIPKSEIITKKFSKHFLEEIEENLRKPKEIRDDILPSSIEQENIKSWASLADKDLKIMRKGKVKSRTKLKLVMSDVDYITKLPPLDDRPLKTLLGRSSQVNFNWKKLEDEINK
jgi:hypothetical protein